MDPYCNYRPFPSKENIMLLMSHSMTTVAIRMANAHFQKSPAVVTGRAHDEQIRSSFPARSCSLPVSRILRPIDGRWRDGWTDGGISIFPVDRVPGTAMSNMIEIA